MIEAVIWSIPSRLAKFTALLCVIAASMSLALLAKTAFALRVPEPLNTLLNFYEAIASGPQFTFMSLTNKILVYTQFTP